MFLGFFGGIALKCHGEAFGAFLDVHGYFVPLGDNGQEALKAFFEEVELHVLVASPEEEVYFDAMTLAQPFGYFVSFDSHVVLGGADFDLRFFGLADMGARLNLFVFFLLLECVDFQVLFAALFH